VEHLDTDIPKNHWKQLLKRAWTNVMYSVHSSRLRESLSIPMYVEVLDKPAVD
jgi:hypothetical protein